MNEQEWCSSNDPTQMLRWLAGYKNVRSYLDHGLALSARRLARKLRLFLVAASRITGACASPPGIAANAVEVAELYADGRATAQQLAAAHVAVKDTISPDAVYWLPPWLPYFATASEVNADGYWTRFDNSHGPRLAETLRDIFGNPWRPIVLPPSVLAWRDHTVPCLARHIYAARDWEAMQVLGDVCEEAGCTDAELLWHLRGGDRLHPVHVRGCHVLDCILGK